MKDLIGKKFGRLKVIRKTDMRKSGNIVWECICECGNKTLVNTSYLKSGDTKSCGCLGLETARKNLRGTTYDGTQICILTAKIRKDNTSGFKGVCWDKSTQKWVSRISIKGKRINLGKFYNKEDAIKARKEAEEKYFKPVIEEFENNQTNNKNFK